MSFNHFSPSEIHQETTHWWNNSTQQNLQPPSSFTMDTSAQLYQNSYHPSWLGGSRGVISQHQPPSLSFNLNHIHNPESQQQILVDEDDKETMFEKPLTPSDVGKLNRLVIPKQYAEKYFPLGGRGGGGGDSGAENGLLLSFEDEAGKCWRFRYSYWNSSQSYVLTKGWSRYVKEKRLDAGDVVLFERRRNDNEHLFIGWRRRAGQDSSQHGASGSTTTNTTSSLARVSGGESGGGTNWTRMFYSAAAPQSYPHQHHQSAAVPYSPDYHLHHAATWSPVNQTPSSSSGGNSRILRLFGVNLECQQQQDDELYSEPSTPDGSSLSSQGPTHHQFYPINNNSTNAYYGDNRDFTFSRDANTPMRNRRG